MSDPRFARLKTDPRFRRPKKHSSKVVVDERFKDIFTSSKSKGKKRQLVDKYGRPLSKTHEQDNLRRFYKLEGSEKPDEEAKSFPDYARGEVLLESSDENDEDADRDDDDSDTGGIITIGKDVNEPNDEEGEIDLDESRFAELDAQAAAYAQSHPEVEREEGSQTCRLAVVNLDWDHVRAAHLYKIFSSVVSPTASALPATKSKGDNQRIRQKGGSYSVAKGQVLSVRVYPSEFGKERMAREEKEGPPPEIFKKRKEVDPDQVNEQTIYEVGDGEEYDEDALRKYQLERLRYYYAIVTCDTVEAAAHIYTELEGTELERSANVLDLSFVPDNMVFDEEFRDEATEDVNINYKTVDFVTDALRHSKVKLTWDDDDPERNLVTRRKFSQKEMEEADFKAYLASSTSESESEDGPSQLVDKKDRKSASRDKLRSLLLGGEDNNLPEGWGMDGGDDVDMEITFTPGLSVAKDGQEETTLEKYQRKLKERKKKRKEELKERSAVKVGQGGPKDDFFGESDDGSDAAENLEKTRTRRKEVAKGSTSERNVSTAEELSLLTVPDHPDAEPKHFNMKSVLKAEKKRRGKNSKKMQLEAENELQEDFSIDVKDERFNALHEDHTFAIDPSNPHFKKTKSMAALLEERSRRHKSVAEGIEVQRKAPKGSESTESSLQALVDRVKRKSTAVISEKHKPSKRQKR